MGCPVTKIKGGVIIGLVAEETAAPAQAEEGEKEAPKKRTTKKAASNGK